MPRWLLPCLVPCLAVLALAGCGGPTEIAEFWRPISMPNIEMPLGQAQKKLDFDLSQCRCGIYPTNVTQSDLIKFQPDKERLAETSLTIKPNDRGECVRQPSLVVSECMRARGWEVTNCSGRMPLAGGGALCAAYAFDP
jgi:hypothetical protein